MIQIISRLSFLGIDEYAVLRVSVGRRQSRIIAVPCRTVGAEDRVLVTHIDIDVRMIVRRGCTDAIKFPHPDADLRGRAVVFEFRIAAHHDSHPGALQLSRARPPFARAPRESSDYRVLRLRPWRRLATRSEEHTFELQYIMSIPDA